MLPVLLLSYMFFSEKRAKRYSLTMPFFLIIAGYIIIRRSLGVMETYPWRTLHEHALGFMTFLRACLTYLRLLVWPVGLHFDRAQQMFLKFSEPGVLETLIAFLGLGTFLIKVRKKVPGYVLFFITSCFHGSEYLGRRRDMYFHGIFTVLSAGPRRCSAQ